MNNQQSLDLYNKFNTELSVIEKDMAEIAQLAAGVSEKFHGIGENLQNFASIAGFGRKGHIAAALIGGAVKVFGQLYADAKKEEALQKLLPKKVEIAEAKTGVINNYIKFLEGKTDQFRTLLQQEISVEFKEEDGANYKEQYEESCQNCYAIYVRTVYSIEICNYMMAEFEAWKMGKHESSLAKPDKAVVLEEVIDMITTPESLIDASNTKMTGGIFLMAKNEAIFAALLNKLHKRSSATEKKTERRVAKRNSFREVKSYIRELKKIEGSKTATHLNWLGSLPTFHEAVKHFKLAPLYLYLFKYYVIGYFVAFLFFRSSLEYGVIDMIFSSLFLSALVSAVIIPISLIIFYLYESDSDKGLTYYILFLIFTVLTFGLMPFAFSRYLQKERNYENFLVQLKVKINQ